jgi:Eukaryotic protein of unknown function (DUF842)
MDLDLFVIKSLDCVFANASSNDPVIRIIIVQYNGTVTAMSTSAREKANDHKSVFHRIMATPAGQAKAQALNSKLEGEARVAIDELERKYMRTQAKSYHTCAAKCYDDRSAEALEMCVSNCEMPHRKASAILQQVSWNLYRLSIAKLCSRFSNSQITIKCIKHL